jgi:outer membrane lipoprotein-sorting protein
MIDRRRALGVAAGALAAAALQGAAPAPQPAASALSPDDEALARRAELYLDGLTTASGRFVQTAADGRTSEGAFWLQRPGRARFDYDPPSGLQIAADGHQVTIVDTRLRTVHSYPLGATPLSLFLARHVALDRGARIEAVRRTADGFSLTLGEGRGRSRGSITLDFRNEPLALTGWAVTDGRGATVRVRLNRLERSAPQPGAFFALRGPSTDAAAAAALR